MLEESDLLRQLEVSMQRNATEIYSLYGDPAYPSRRQFLSLIRHPVKSQEQALNTNMSSGRQTVEWYFGNISTLFAFLEKFENLVTNWKVLLCWCTARQLPLLSVRKRSEPEVWPHSSGLS